MHALTAVLLVGWAFRSGFSAHKREGTGENCCRAALAEDDTAGREFQLALFTVFKAQGAYRWLCAELASAPQSFGREVAADVRARL
jgi:hypothetical protein